MKNWKPAIYAIVVLLLANILFSFKSDVVSKEYGTIQFIETTRKDAIIINIAGETKNISTESMGDEKTFLQALNTFAAAGWTISSTDYTSTGAYTKRVVYLERIK